MGDDEKKKYIYIRRPWKLRMNKRGIIGNRWIKERESVMGKKKWRRGK